MSTLSASARRSVALLDLTASVLFATVFAVAAGRPATGASASPPAIENADCLGCHGDNTLETSRPDGKPRSLFVDEAVFATSIHGKNRCTSCHGDIVEVPHPEGFRPKDVSCAQCHRLETGIYLASDHGLAVHQGVGEAASCKDCHGATHTLLDSRDPASPVNRTNITRTCARCHANAGEMEKFHLRQSQPRRQLRAERPRTRAGGESGAERRGVHRLSRLARPAPIHQHRVQAALAQRAHHVRAMPRERGAHLRPQRARQGRHRRGPGRARLHRLSRRAHHFRGEACPSRACRWNTCRRPAPSATRHGASPRSTSSHRT